MAQAQTSRDDDALKKKTDCVYFLASPLTCKKGNDCEFRHSESARVNPRDCWYWLAGTCLMPDCPFRHPPLEGRTAGGATAGPPVPGATGVNKARTPCYFFSQGYCVKGDKCPFLHGPATSTSSLPQVAAALQKPAKAIAPEVTEKKTGSAPAPEKPQTAEGPVNPPRRPIEARLSTPIAGKSTSQGSPRKEGQTPGLQNGAGIGRADVQLATSTAVLGSNNRLRVRQPSGDERPQNGMEPDEWWEESSPGFDVLVDAGPERSHYSEDPDLQGNYEGLEAGRPGPAVQRRGRGLHGADEIDQYDYEYQGVFEPAAYDATGLYNHGGYESYEQQGYEHAPAYEQRGHPRSGVYLGRGIEEMYGRERDRMISSRDGESGLGTNHRASRELKRPRGDGPPYHILENRSRQRTESGHGEGKGSGSVGDVDLAYLRRDAGRSALRRDNGRPRPASKVEAMTEAEILPAGVNSTAVRGSEGRKEQPSNFAGPKTLAQILAEKRKGGARDDSSKAKEMSGDLRKVDGPIDSYSQNQKAPNFAGPKSLSAILQAKRKGGSETVGNPDIATLDQNHRQRLAEGVTSPVSNPTKAAVMDAHIPGVTTRAEDTGLASEHPDVEDQPNSYKERRLESGSPMMQDDELVDSADTVRNDSIVEELDSVRAAGNEFFNAEKASSEADTRDRDVVFEEDDDEDFGLDDEDEDFAKKLGGFFS
ncbi:unnamed protein product [Sphagnum jensenii]|uniref:C3H1-type domain-containing protein n=1 Tax=Sphagnum jensenii TaxID=128206 RepID=A0ABP0VZ41_9BRYO